MKAILICGGKGTRVSELTGGITPKGFIRLSKRFPRPLMAYQLDQLKKAGVKDVLLIPQYDWQIPLYKHSIRAGEFPNLNYSFLLHDAIHPFTIFREKGVLKFIDKSDFLFTYADIYYSKETLEKMKKLQKNNSTSVASGMYSKSKRWRKGKKFLTFSRGRDGKIFDMGYSDEADFTIHSPFLFSNKDLKIIVKEAKEKEPRTIHLLSDLVKKDNLSVAMPDLLVNMTTLQDAHTVEKALKKSLK